MNIISGIKLLLIFLLSIFFTNAANCQYNATDIDFIKSVYKTEITIGKNLNTPVIYVDSAFKGFNDERDLLSATTNFKNVLEKSFNITKPEQEYIISQLDSMKYFKLPENLFNNSKRIKEKEIFIYAKASYSYDSVANRRIFNPNYVYRFSKPIFIRDKKIALFMYAKICGGLCGNTKSMFYNFENGEWHKYVTIVDGEF